MTLMDASATSPLIEFSLDISALEWAHKTLGLPLKRRHLMMDLRTCRVLLAAATRHWERPLSFTQAVAMVTEATLPIYAPLMTMTLCRAAGVPYDPSATSYDQHYPYEDEASHG